MLFTTKNNEKDTKSLACYRVHKKWRLFVEIFLGKPPTHIENWIKNNGTYNVTITNNTDNNTLYGRFESSNARLSPKCVSEMKYVVGLLEEM